MRFVSEGLVKNLGLGVGRFEKSEAFVERLNGWVDIHCWFPWRSRTT